jgi:hypothetical protein
MSPVLEKDPYAALIAHLVDAHITTADRSVILIPLLTAIGCGSLHYDGDLLTSRMSEQPGSEAETLVMATLKQALHRHIATGFTHTNDSFSLLNGLCTKDRWCNCLSNEENALCLAALCATLVYENQIDPALGEFDQQGFGLCALLNEWLQPVEPFEKWPSLEILLGALFGDAWYEFEVLQQGYKDWYVPILICERRPIFVPGLLPSQDLIALETLPTLN